MTHKPNTIFVNIDIISIISQEQLNQLVDHFKKLERFDFKIKSEIFTSISRQQEESKKSEYIMSGSDIHRRILST
jgi:ADP-glucose pyrophosphorylase